MDVILLQRVVKLGQMGDVVKVKPGFARNFLLPQKKALRATPDNLKRFESQRGQLEAVNLQHRQEAETISGKIEGLTVTVIRQAGESGQLYGSVAARDISDAVTAAGFTVSRNQILIESPIKTLGRFPVRVALHPEVSAKITVTVARTIEEAQRANDAAAPAPVEAEPEIVEEATAENPA